MLSSLNSGVSGLECFQEAMNVIGNNIANVNTVGYKSARAEFADSFSNTLKIATGSTGTTSSTSSMQVGTGVHLGGVKNLFTQGSLANTTVDSDLAINGEGFFVVADSTNGKQYATRDGTFKINDQGYLTTQNGLRVQGFSDSALSTRGDIKIAYSTGLTDGSFTVNGKEVLVSAKDDLDQVLKKINAATIGTGSEVTGEYNSSTKQITLTSDKTITLGTPTSGGTNFLTMAGFGTATYGGTLASTATIDSTALSTIAAGDFQVNGQTVTVAAGDSVQQILDKIATATSNAVTGSYDAANQKLTLKSNAPIALTSVTGGSDFIDKTKLSSAEFSGSMANAVGVGNVLATMQSYSIDDAGKIKITLNDNTSFISGQILLQNFTDKTALSKEGDNLYSGIDIAGPLGGSESPTTQPPGSNGMGAIKQKTLEMSSVDLTKEFANMITVQRSFQAAARVVTTSDEMLNETVNLKR
jgi:flagellar hook protein FlgE